METNIRVGDIMTRDFIHIHPGTPVLHCAKKMIKNRAGSIVLKDNEKIHGVLTEKDIIWALTKNGDKGLKDIKAKDIATRKIITIRPEAPLDQALLKMNKKKVRRLPVMHKKQIVGYITLNDILRFRPSLFESLAELQHIKEEAEKLKRSEQAMQRHPQEDYEFIPEEDDEE